MSTTNRETQKVIINTSPCLHCWKDSEVEVEGEKYIAWKKGAKIQDVWPEKSAEWREVLMTGIHPECWKEMFGREED